MITAHLKVRNLEQAWLGIMQEIMDRGREYRKDGGSRAGMLRKALDFMTVEISHPEERPLVPLAKPGCISPCTEADAEEYLNKYLYNTEPPAENESYTYAQYLTPAVHATAKWYAKAGFYVQQAVMPVGMPDDVNQYLGEQVELPLLGGSITVRKTNVSIPCLRMIDTRIISLPAVNGPIDKPTNSLGGIVKNILSERRDFLHYYIYFRAWNHFGAFPLNMAGIQLLKELHCAIIEHESGRPVLPGPTLAMSKDCHVNDIEWSAANAWLGR